MVPDREPEGQYRVFFSDGSEIIVKPLPHGFKDPLSGYAADRDTTLSFLVDSVGGGMLTVWGRLVGDNQDGCYRISAKHIVLISPYSESVPDTEPVGRATVEEPSSERPPFEVSGY